MSSSYQKLTDGIIFYSLAVSDFEILDFRNDALAGVRANYFNTGLRTQADETEISIDKVDYKMSYRMSRNLPFSWKVSRNSRPYQSAKRETGGVYCVIYYAENGVVYKRQYFDSEHIWIRTEYFDREICDELICRIYPLTVKGVVLLIKEVFSGGEAKKSVLFPSNNRPLNIVSALAYSNLGMVWYDECFMPKNFLDNIDSGDDFIGQNSFKLDANKFESDYNPDNVIDIQNLEYLEDDDLHTDENSDTDNQIQNDEGSKEYSAYDRIEKILIEAHKTNKNLFGEVLEHSVDMAQDDSELTENTEDDDFDKGDAESIEFEQKQEESCDSVVNSKSGSYSYYGSLDENGLRTGKGRTVSPDGFTAYDGEYKNDKRDGFGVFYYKNGDINYVGEWLENKRNGAGTGYRSSDGTMHAGKWKDNTPDGYGARFDKDGNFIDVAFYTDGLKNGKSVSFDENGNVCVSVWENGQKISECIIE